MPGGVSVICSAVIIHTAAVPIAIPTTPSPAATSAAHHRSHRYSRAERKHAGCYQISSTVPRRIVRCSVHHGWVITGHVHDLRVCWLNDDCLRRLLDDGDL